MPATSSGAGPRLSAIVLAAGESRRMGSRNKLLLDFGGVALVRHVVSTLLAARRWQEVVVVVGHQASSVAEALEGLSVAIALHSGYRQGQASSVRCGLRALQRDYEGVAVILGDQPSIDAHDLEALCRAFAARGSASVIVPTFEGRRGNPIVLDRCGVEEILRRDGHFGCRHLIEHHSDLVRTVAMTTDHVVRDVDAPSDYAALRNGDRPVN